jgi:hypothetical protein
VGDRWVDREARGAEVIVSDGQVDSDVQGKIQSESINSQQSALWK